MAHAANCSYSLIEISAEESSCEISLNLSPCIRPIYTMNSIGRLTFQFELLGRLGNNQAELPGKQQGLRNPLG